MAHHRIKSWKTVQSKYEVGRSIKSWEGGEKFGLDSRANKTQIKHAIEKIHNVKVIKVNTIITPKGEKKALIKLHPNYSAQDIAIDLGIF